MVLDIGQFLNLFVGNWIDVGQVKFKKRCLAVSNFFGVIF